MIKNMSRRRATTSSYSWNLAPEPLSLQKLRRATGKSGIHKVQKSYMVQHMTQAAENNEWRTINMKARYYLPNSH